MVVIPPAYKMIHVVDIIAYCRFVSDGRIYLLDDLIWVIFSYLSTSFLCTVHLVDNHLPISLMYIWFHVFMWDFVHYSSLIVQLNFVPRVDEDVSQGLVRFI